MRWWCLINVHQSKLQATSAPTPTPNPPSAAHDTLLLTVLLLPTHHPVAWPISACGMVFFSLTPACFCAWKSVICRRASARIVRATNDVCIHTDRCVCVGEPAKKNALFVRVKLGLCVSRRRFYVCMYQCYVFPSTPRFPGPFPCRFPCGGGGSG